MAFELVATDKAVDLRSDERLPFEPKGELRAMRDALRDALRELNGPSLTAWLEGPFAAGFDLENVLFYNVGCSVFTGCARALLRFERRYSITPAPSGEMRAWHHRYQILEERSLWRYNLVGTSFRMEGAGAPPRSAAAFWLAAQRARTHYAPVSAETPLFLRLRLGTSRTVNLAEAAKRITDGVCSSFHSCFGAPDPEVQRRVTQITGCEESEAAAWLARPGPLGPARFVWPFGSGLQWSPADHRIVASEISAVSVDRDWFADVELYEALPAD